MSNKDELTQALRFGDLPAQTKCATCRYFSRQTESWEMPHIFWYECSKRPQNEHLKTFPFRNGCKYFAPTRARSTETGQ